MPISKSDHSNCGWKKPQGYGFFSNNQIVQVLLAELPKLISCYPLAFIANQDKFLLVALLGVEHGRNVFISTSSEWDASYVPSSVRGYPFSLVRLNDDSLTLCISEECLVCTEAAPEPLFQPSGELAPHVANTVDFLRHCDANREVTQRAVDVLASMNLIEVWPIQYRYSDRLDTTRLSGIYRINQECLHGLEEKALKKLMECGALGLAYAQLFSMEQLQPLIARAKLQCSGQSPLAGMPELDDIFGSEDSFNFDFLKKE